MKLKTLIGRIALSEIPSQLDCLFGLSGSFIMKEIKLTQGKVALVDDEDFYRLNAKRWQAAKNSSTFYAVRYANINGKSKTIHMHRTIMKEPDGKVIDHRNHNGLDNRKENLRIVTQRENSQNRLKICKSGYMGVIERYGKFYARIRIDGKLIVLGKFTTASEASAKYNDISNNLTNKLQ